MLRMNQIDEIKQLQRQGLGPQEIAGRLNLNRKTAARYMKVEDFNGSPLGKRASASKLDPWKPKIDEWLAEDRRMRFKQRHTAKRVHERLEAEYGEAYRSSYPLAQRYLKEKKRERGYLDLIWAPGKAQADFGGSRCRRGRRQTGDQVPLSELPPQQRRVRPDVRRGDGRVRLPGTRGHLPLDRRGAAADRL